MHAVGAWRTCWLGCWLAGRQLAGWLMAWLELAARLAGHGDTGSVTTWSKEGRKIEAEGSDTSLFAELQDWNTTKVQGHQATSFCRPSRLHKLQCWRDWEACKVWQEIRVSLAALKGPADMYTVYTYRYICTYTSTLLTRLSTIIVTF